VDPDTRGQRVHQLALDNLPDGAFVLRDGTPWVVLGDELLAWTPAGYTDRLARPTGHDARVLTPPSLLDVLRAGWAPEAVTFLHPSALAPTARRSAVRGSG
jgi:hypothetical protein